MRPSIGTAPFFLTGETGIARIGELLNDRLFQGWVLPLEFVARGLLRKQRKGGKGNPEALAKARRVRESSRLKK